MKLSKQDLHLVGDPPPVDPQQFLDELWILRRLGNPVKTFIELCLHVSRRKTYLGEPVTLDLIKDKYMDYLRYCERTGQEGKFIKGLYNWISDADYNSDYEEGENEALKRYS